MDLLIIIKVAISLLYLHIQQAEMIKKFSVHETDENDTSNMYQLPDEFTHFETMLNEECYVDKSLLIYEMLTHKKKIVMVTAPRSFGKTINNVMLRDFLQIEVDKYGHETVDRMKTKNYEKFKNMLIHKKHKHFFESHVANYPVVSLNYHPLKYIMNFEDLVDIIRFILFDAFRQHVYLTHVNELWTERSHLAMFRNYTHVSDSANLSLSYIKRGLEFLLELLHRYFKRKVVVLIDEFDGPMDSIIMRHAPDADKMIRFMKSFNGNLMSHYCKQHVSKYFINGMLCTLGEGMMSYRRRIKRCYNFQFSHRYSKYYGLTEPELDHMLKLNEKIHWKPIGELKKSINEYYAPYNVMGDKSLKIYNYISAFRYIKRVRFKTYWARSRSYEHIDRYIKFFLPNWDFRQTARKLLKNYTITMDHSMQYQFSKKDCLIFNKIFHYPTSASLSDRIESENIILQLFFQYGFLTFNSSNVPDPKNALVRMPNYEIVSRMTEVWTRAEKKIQKKIREKYKSKFSSIGQSSIGL